MTIQDLLSQLPGAERVDELPDAWFWSPAPGVCFGVRPTVAGRRAIQVTWRDSDGRDLCLAVLAFARLHDAVTSAPSRPLLSVPGFACDGYAFDTLGVKGPDEARMFVKRPAEVNRLLVPVFPAFHVEFGGDENADEAKFRTGRMNTTDFGREPSPYLKVRSDNVTTLSRVGGPDREFVDSRAIYNQISMLEGSAGSYVEFETWRHRVFRLAWDGRFQVSGPEGTAAMGLEELVTLVDREVLDAP